MLFPYRLRRLLCQWLRIKGPKPSHSLKAVPRPALNCATLVTGRRGPRMLKAVPRLALKRDGELGATLCFHHCSHAPVLMMRAVLEFPRFIGRAGSVFLPAPHGPPAR